MNKDMLSLIIVMIFMLTVVLWYFISNAIKERKIWKEILKEEALFKNTEI